MSTPTGAVVFVLGAAVSLGASWLLVSRIERVGSRLGAPEALLGLIAALAADGPEITSAVSALVAHRADVGAGVVIGSNVFNLAALLGLGSIVAGSIALHRRTVLFQGGIGLWIAAFCLLEVVGAVPDAGAFVAVLAVLGPYALVAALVGTTWWRRPARSALGRWVTHAVAEEEVELSAAIHPRRGRSVDVVVGSVALVVVVVASVAMEHSASELGTHFAVPGILVGAVVLAAVTSLPNAVAAIYWARRGRGVATLSTALNSNALNVFAGLLLPSLVFGTGHRSGLATLVAAWYVASTVAVVALAYRHVGVRRTAGWLIVASYAAFVVVLSLVA